MTCLLSLVIVLVVGAIAAARITICKARAVAREDARFELAPTIDHEPIVAEFRRGGAL